VGELSAQFQELLPFSCENGRRLSAARFSSTALVTWPPWIKGMHCIVFDQNDKTRQMFPKLLQNSRKPDIFYSSWANY
jgi:hypothetical protein